MHTFGHADGVPSQTTLIAALNRLRATSSARKVAASKVAKRINQRGTITGSEVLAVAADIPLLVTVSGSDVYLTGAGRTAARSRMTPRYAVR